MDLSLCAAICAFRRFFFRRSQPFWLQLTLISAQGLAKVFSPYFRFKYVAVVFVDWSASHATYGSRTQSLHKALILLWARVRANMWEDLAGITSTCVDFRFSKWPSARKLGYFWTETLRCGRDRRDLWGRSMFCCSFSASQWIVCYARYWWIDRNT